MASGYATWAATVAPARTDVPEQPNYRPPPPHGSKRPAYPQNVHASLSAYFCEMCDRSFNTPAEFDTHRSQHQKVRSLLAADGDAIPQAPLLQHADADYHFTNNSLGEETHQAPAASPRQELPPHLALLPPPRTREPYPLPRQEPPPHLALLPPPRTREPYPDPQRSRDPYADPYTEPYASARRAALPIGPLALDRDPYLLAPATRDLRAPATRDPFDRLAADRERYLAGLHALYPHPESFRMALEDDRAMMLSRTRAQPPPPQRPRRDPYPDPYADPYLDPYVEDYLPQRRLLPARRPYYGEEEDPYVYGPPPPKRSYGAERGRGRGGGAQGYDQGFPVGRGRGDRGRDDRGRGDRGRGHRGRGDFECGRGGQQGQHGQHGQHGPKPELKPWVKKAIEESKNDEGKIECPASMCTRLYRTEQTMFFHWREAHQPKMWKFGCLLCETQTKRLLGVRRHYVSEHGLEPDDFMPWHSYVYIVDFKSRNQQFHDPQRAPPKGFREWEDIHLQRFTFKGNADPRYAERLRRIIEVRTHGITGTGDVRSKQWQKLEDERVSMEKDAGYGAPEMVPPEDSELAEKLREFDERKAELCKPGPELLHALRELAGWF